MKLACKESRIIFPVGGGTLEGELRDWEEELASADMKVQLEERDVTRDVTLWELCGYRPGVDFTWFSQASYTRY